MRRQSRGTSRGGDRNRQCTQRRRANESRTEQNRTERAGKGRAGQGQGRAQQGTAGPVSTYSDYLVVVEPERKEAQLEESKKTGG